jgi:hypothetical protein
MFLHRRRISKKMDEDDCYEWAETNSGLTLVAGNVDAQAAGKEAAKDAGKDKVVGGAAVGGRLDLLATNVFWSYSAAKAP